MKNRPLFSITTPCFNSAKTIERTINSILEQEYKEYEYIIVDGGSIDGTLDIIKQYEPQFNGRMKWKSEPDKGLYDAFNKGIERSTGIYCWNVNADDWIEPDALTKLSEFIKELKQYPLPVISGKMNFVSLEGKLIRTACSNQQIVDAAYRKDRIGVPHPATLVPKDMYKTYGTYDPYYKIIGDADWFHRVYNAGMPFKFIEEVLTNMSDGGISNQFSYKLSLRDRIHFLQKHYKNPFTRLHHWFKWTIDFYVQKHAHLNKG